MIYQLQQGSSDSDFWWCFLEFLAPQNHHWCPPWPIPLIITGVFLYELHLPRLLKLVQLIEDFSGKTSWKNGTYFQVRNSWHLPRIDRDRCPFHSFSYSFGWLLFFFLLFWLLEKTHSFSVETWELYSWCPTPKHNFPSIVLSIYLY